MMGLGLMQRGWETADPGLQAGSMPCPVTQLGAATPHEQLCRQYKQSALHNTLPAACFCCSKSCALLPAVPL